MPRQPNDGRGRLGGRDAGTPNKNNPMRPHLQAINMRYFTEPVFITDDGETITQCEADLRAMTPEDRINAMIRLLPYHCAQLKAIAIDAAVSDNTAATLSQRLRDLTQ